MNRFETTDAQGRAVFNLPQQGYKVRVDYLGYPFWSDAFTWQDQTVTVQHGKAIVEVKYNGYQVIDAPVYLFTASGAYLNQYERTDTIGRASFLLPAQPYKFRVDYQGTQYWSDEVTVIVNQENVIELNLEQLALDLTHDPNPVRFDGEPPVYRPGPVRVAALGSLTGLLSQAVISQTHIERVYYYINDHLGTPQKVMDESGTVVWSADYEPFGDTSITTAAMTNPFRFPGQYFDSETGFHYNYHRYYDPKTGRYLTPDPIGLVDDKNGSSG